MADINRPTTEELVKKVYPTAYVHDDGEKVYVYKRVLVEVGCSTCGHTHSHYESSMTCYNMLGAGNCAEAAWDNAAKSLGKI